MFAAGQQQPTPLLIGTNSRERSPGLAKLPDDLSDTLRKFYGPLADRAIALYSTVDAVYGTPAEQWAGDTAWRCEAVTQALAHANAGHATYHYEFSRSAPGRKTTGPIHTAEMWYVFGTLGLGRAPAGPPPQYDAIDEMISQAMQTYWTNFARRGDPNGDRLPIWPRFEDRSRMSMQFTDRGPIAAKDVRRSFCELHAENNRRVTAR